MNEKQAIFFVNISKKFGFDRAQLSCFDSKTVKLIESNSQNSVSYLPSIAFIDPKEFLDNLHYSWIIQAIATLTDATKNQCIATLNAKLARPLLKYFKLQPPSKIQSPFLNQMTSWFLFKACVPKTPLPKALLPNSFFNLLLNYSKNQLEHLFDRLGLYDLAAELQEIVDKKVYLQIFNELTKVEKEWLMEILAKKQLWALPKLGINSWLKDKSLRLVLHKRGILRFCVGASGISSDFLWHFTHKLDTGRANMIKQMIKPEAIEPASIIIKDQIRLTIEQIKYKMEST